MEFKDKNILILAPHTDDGELGCGATIVKAIEDGANVSYIAFSTAEASVPEGFPKNQLELEVKEATQLLGIHPENLHIFRYEVRKLNFARQEILETLIRMRADLNPDIVFVPSLNDIHQDHSTIANEGLRAFKNRCILGYELVWNNRSFDTDCFIKIRKEHLDRKVEALKLYKTQEGRAYMDEEFIRSLAKVRGTQIATTYAEAFEVIRYVIE